MKKTFYSVLRTICVGAMTLFAVSCYDDSFLREDIAELEGQLAGIVARLDSMEVSLNSDVGTVTGLEATLKTLENSLKELIAANGADVKTALEAQIADLKSKLEKAIADGDKANADALATQKAALEQALAAIAEGAASVEELAAIVAALEEQGSELQAVVEELYTQIAVVAVEEVDGKVVLTLANGSKVEVSKPVDHAGLVTIVEVDGVKYWQVVGAETHTGVVVGHPDQNIEFQINADTKELEFRVNGTEWISTGVVVEEEAGANVITAFEEGDDYVKLTIGETEIVLPKYTAGDFDLTFGREEVYFAYGSTKKLALATEGVVEYYVMSKPDGWKASIEDGKVVVVAPTTAFIEMGVADAKGELLVHANTEAGACKVVKVDLVAGPGLTLSFADGVLKYFNALAGEQSNFWGDVWYDFQDVWFGIVTVDELLEVGSFEAFIASQPEPIGGLQTTLMNIFQTGYVEGEYEEFTPEVTLEQLIEESWCGYELAEGETYVVWAVPSGDATTPWIYDQAVYAVTDTYVDFVQGTPAYNNVPYTATFFGADGFAVGATSKTQFDSWGVDGVEYTYEMALQEFLMGSWQPGPLMNFNEGMRSAMGKIYGAGNHEINLKDILLADYGQIPPVEPNTEYFVWVLPYVDGKSDYTFEDLQLVTCKTNPLAYSETLAPVVTIDAVASDAVTFTIVPPAGGQTAYELMTAADFEQFIDPEFGDIDTGAIVDYLKWSWAIDSKYTEEYGSWFIEANTEYVLVTYNTANGEYSVTYEKFTTPGEAEVTADTPAGKQWVFTSEYWDAMITGGMFVGEYCFDLGVSFPTLYPEMFTDPNTAVIGINYEPMGAPAGTWMPAFPSYGSFTITPTDETSGVMVWLGMEVPYYGYDGQSCTFDLGTLVGEDPGVALIEATLATTEIWIQAQ